MKDYQVGWVITIVILLLIAALCSVNLHTTGYLQGATHVRLYYEATGEFPSKDWLSANEGKHLYFPQQIMETLKPYGEKR